MTETMQKYAKNLADIARTDAEQNTRYQMELKLQDLQTELNNQRSKHAVETRSWNKWLAVLRKENTVLTNKSNKYSERIC